jgi:hypothetical protein
LDKRYLISVEGEKVKMGIFLIRSTDHRLDCPIQPPKAPLNRILHTIIRFISRKININHIHRVSIFPVSVILATCPLKAEGPAQRLSNPVGYVSVPFQNNFESGVKPNQGFKWTMNLQPILPFSLNRNWNLINRIHLPVIRQNNVVGRTSQSGIGDAVLNVLLSPKSDGVIWGVGPAIYFPTGSHDYLTGKK